MKHVGKWIGVPALSGLVAIGVVYLFPNLNAGLQGIIGAWAVEVLLIVIWLIGAALGTLLFLLANVLAGFFARKAEDDQAAAEAIQEFAERHPPGGMG